MIFVDGENATDADPFGPLTSIVVPDTDAIDPLTSSSPLTFTGASDVGAAAADAAGVVVGDLLGELVVDDPQATADNAVTPMVTSTDRRVVDDFRIAAPDQYRVI
jgi:hypothetical protein